MKNAIIIAILSFFSIVSYAQDDFMRHVDPTIGNVARFLVPTYPTIQLLNQMIRMFPIKKDYITDQVEAFPLQVTGHREKEISSPFIIHEEIMNGGNLEIFRNKN